ncbi:hypothetical protein OG496_18860 [Streptomyces sp. NBC_00988]|uniref:hypothetical protein n=1 Tax=Streptomyces sp. NBC_00988 TaxID=2903704 RepID=UPI00386F1232|nr:hypothetical protein OG496_18860 [Streptomyces sp. NBC_00988]
MARWRKKFLTEVTEKLVQLGLKSCPVCNSESLGAKPWPVMAEIGGLHSAKDIVADDDQNVLFLVGVECSACGHLLLFNSERFRTGNDATLVRGLTHEEETEAEERGMWED